MVADTNGKLPSQGTEGKRPRIPYQASTRRERVETYFDTKRGYIVTVYLEMETDKIINVVTKFH